MRRRRSQSAGGVSHRQQDRRQAADGPARAPGHGQTGVRRARATTAPILKYLRKQARMRKRERGIALSQAQHELAREYGFASWPPPGLALVTWP
jgi:hypothetical protein